MSALWMVLVASGAATSAQGGGTALQSDAARIAIALGVGLLIGIERERSKGRGPTREVAGVRTFMLTSLTGALALFVGGEMMLVAAAAVLGLLIATAYRFTRENDPGLTTEVALLTTFLLGAMCMRAPALAAGLSVVVALLLAARKRLHRWVRDVLTDQEVHDALILAAAVLVILPLTPATAVDPWGVLIPQRLWGIAVLLMAVNTAGYVALRVLGARAGLPLAGFISGFISSTATIAGMGARAKEQPALRPACVAGAALSSVATVVQLSAILTLAGPQTLARAAGPLAAAGAAATAYGALFTIRSAREKTPAEPTKGRPFDVRTALWFAAMLGAAGVVSAFLTSRFGPAGSMAAAGLTGLADAHAAAASAASLAAGGAAAVETAAIGVIVALTANTVTKCLVAAFMGDGRFAAQVVPGLLLMVAAAWSAAAATGLIG